MTGGNIEKAAGGRSRNKRKVNFPVKNYLSCPKDQRIYCGIRLVHDQYMHALLGFITRAKQSPCDIVGKVLFYNLM